MEDTTNKKGDQENYQNGNDNDFEPTESTDASLENQNNIFQFGSVRVVGKPSNPQFNDLSCLECNSDVAPKMAPVARAIDQSTLAPIERIVIPSDVIDINPNDQSVYIVGTRGLKVTRIIGLDGMPNLKEVTLRSCLVSDMSGAENLKGLVKLELYDNSVEEICNLSQLTGLEILDISFNSIRDMSPVSCCSRLKELYIAQNKLRKIEGLENMPYLEILDLGANRIRSMEGLQHLTTLKSLWLGKNKIENIECVSQLKMLRQLDIQNNRLTELGEELIDLENLRELFLACNRITCPVGLPIQSLSILDLSSNNVGDVRGIEGCANLEELWMTNAVFESFEDLKPLQSLSQLTCLYLEHSPLWKRSDYKATMISLFPKLTQLDAENV